MLLDIQIWEHVTHVTSANFLRIRRLHPSNLSFALFVLWTSFDKAAIASVSASGGCWLASETDVKEPTLSASALGMQAYSRVRRRAANVDNICRKERLCMAFPIKGSSRNNDMQAQVVQE